MVGIWCINFLSGIKKIDLDEVATVSQKKKFSLIEFGPGKGSLMCDVLRTFG
jgi:SAM-dependent MidA family methyltransferase